MHNIEPFLKLSKACVKLDYGDENRFYHNFDHVEFMLRELETIPVGGQSKDSLALATLYHDVIYNPQSDNNELLSAQGLLLIYAEYQKLLTNKDDFLYHSAVVNEAMKIIIESPSATPTSPITVQLFHDLDFSVLGAPMEQYDRYAAGVAKEYCGDTITEEYKLGRAKFLGSMAGKRVFCNPLRLEKYELMEAAARANIQREFASL